jgi:predicted ATPase/DNA-binding CsgD family transcriptional regulator
MAVMSDSGVLAESGISAREAEVLAALGEHLTNAEIGAKLFISVRTVESHVSSLLRKLGATDRRELADLATRMVQDDRANVPPVLPSPLTSFIGREKERRELADALQEHRQVSAVGPGGVGKTRLALAVTADVADRFADGVWFVNLVPVTDPAMIGPAVAAALGIGERQGRSVEGAVAASLADGETLIVLDNCEHVVDGVAPFVERLLGDCPRLTVLATSRARLMVPFEWVFPVPPLSLPDDQGHSDAVALFEERSAAVGWALDAAGDRDRVVQVCRALDGVALAIELAVARLPVLGFDGLQAGLSNHLRLLSGGPRADDRHRSVRAVLDWSHALLSDADQVLLRRVAVFASPFTADAAVDVTGFPPLDPGGVADGLAHLAVQSLLTAVPTAGGTRYRALETIRQYGLERMAQCGDLDRTRSQHLRWSRTAASVLERDAANVASWRARFDQVVDDLRAAMGWAAEHPDHRSEAHDFALVLARLAFSRGLMAESQHRYEHAARLTADPAVRASALRYASAAANCRLFGDDALRLLRAAADAALLAGDTAGAAHDLADAATTIHRAPGIMSRIPPSEEADQLIAAARDLAGGDTAARAAILVAEAFRAEAGFSDPATISITEDAVRLARQAGDVFTESAALDALTAVQAGLGRVIDAAATARRRAELLRPLPVDAAVGFELFDTMNMVAETSIGAGDLGTARRWAERIRTTPTLAEEGHIATARLIVVDALAGSLHDAIAGSERFREGWERSGRRPASNLGMVAAAVAMTHGLAGDDEARAEWLGIIDALAVSPERLSGYGATFDAIVFLHRGDAARALDRMAAEPEDLRRWTTGMWRHWYAALKAEAAVLAGHTGAAGHLDRARAVVAGNPVAAAIVDRATALQADDRTGMLSAATALDRAGCRYQWARTLALAGGDEQAEGAAALTDLGASPMTTSRPA